MQRRDGVREAPRARTNSRLRAAAGAGAPPSRQSRQSTRRHRQGRHPPLPRRGTADGRPLETSRLNGPLASSVLRAGRISLGRFPERESESKSACEKFPRGTRHRFSSSGRLCIRHPLSRPPLPPPFPSPTVSERSGASVIRGAPYSSRRACYHSHGGCRSSTPPSYVFPRSTACCLRRGGVVALLFFLRDNRRVS